MSRADSVVKVSSDDRCPPSQFQRLPCGKCYAAIEYCRGTNWSAVSELVKEHWNACPGKPHGRPAGIPRAPPSPPDTAIVLPPLEVKQRHPLADSVGFPNTAWVSSSGYERKRKTLEQRKLELEQDEYARNVTTKSVVCVGCDREISLDKRSKYYPGLWNKHRGKCPEIKKRERAKVNSKVVLNGTRQCHVDIPMSCSNGCEAAQLEPCPTESYEGQCASGTDRPACYSDSDDPVNDEDEDEEEEDAMLLESFPTLNARFRLEQRDCDDWTHRYATKDEVATNRFRGQEEACGRLGSRPWPHYCPQMGGHCETSRCVMENRVERAFSQDPNEWVA